MFRIDKAPVAQQTETGDRTGRGDVFAGPQVILHSDTVDQGKALWHLVIFLVATLFPVASGQEVLRRSCVKFIQVPEISDSGE